MKRLAGVFGLFLIALGLLGLAGLAPAAAGMGIRRIRPSTGVLVTCASVFALLGAAGLLRRVPGYTPLDHLAHLAMAAGCVVAARLPPHRVTRMA
jgi:hypothetical protein